MGSIDAVFKKNEGMNVERIDECVRRNFICYIIKTFLNSIKTGDNIDYLTRYFLDYSFIKDINIDNGNCVIDYYDDDDICRSISFSIVPDELCSKFGSMFYDKTTGKYLFFGNCHSVVFKFLEKYPDCGLSAVTSICESFNNVKYFHSYLWDKNSNDIIDFSRNIIMKKEQYDMLFCFQEINVMDYNSIIESLNNLCYCPERDKYCRLLYLALVTLSKEEKVLVKS